MNTVLDIMFLLILNLEISQPQGKEAQDCGFYENRIKKRAVLIDQQQRVLYMQKRKGKLLPKNEETSGGKAHTNTWKLNQNILSLVMQSLSCVHIHSFSCD